MAYTRYPAEAASFSSAAQSITNKLDNISSSLGDIKNILDSSRNDFLSLKALAANQKIESVVSDAKKAITGDVGKVKKIADDLEEEEKQRQDALNKNKKGGEGSEQIK